MMKLLTTIQKIVEEAEDRYYKASRDPNITPVELRILESKVEESLNLLDFYMEIDQE